MHAITQTMEMESGTTLYTFPLRSWRYAPIAETTLRANVAGGDASNSYQPSYDLYA